jgi:hypothetical protein
MSSSLTGLMAKEAKNRWQRNAGNRKELDSRPGAMHGAKEEVIRAGVLYFAKCKRRLVG